MRCVSTIPIAVILLLASPGALDAAELEPTAADEEPEAPDTGKTDRPKKDRAEMLRTKVEWFALRTHGGNYGGGLMASVVTLRWRHFYWDILRGGGGSSGRAAGWGVGGTVAGVPLHIGDEGKHEVRLGVGLMAGIMAQVNGTSTRSNGPFIVVEVYWVFHLFKYFALQAGADAYIAVTHTGTRSTPTPVFTGFFGIRI